MQVLPSAGRLTLSLTQGFKIVDSPPFICDGSYQMHMLETKQRTAVHALGFLGSIESDGCYDVTVEIKGSEMTSGNIEQRVLGERGKIFYFVFQNPIILEPEVEGKSENNYSIFYRLKGPPTSAVQRILEDEVLLKEQDSEFLVQWHSHQLAEIIFTKL